MSSTAGQRPRTTGQEAPRTEPEHRPGEPRNPLARLVRWVGQGMSPLDRPDLRVFAMLVAIDAVFVALYLVHAATSLLPSAMFSIAFDGSHSERFQYLKELSIVVMLAMLAVRRQRSMFAVLSALYLYLLLDDSLEIHEVAGSAIATAFGLVPTPVSRAQDLGEIMVSAIAGVVFLGLGTLAYRRSDAATRAVARWYVALTVLLAGAGVGVDLIHARSAPRWFRGVLNIMEDGSEMVVMSAVVAFSVGLVRATASRVREHPR